MTDEQTTEAQDNTQRDGFELVDTTLHLLHNPGWVCPVCGGGNAPWVARCPCVPIQVDYTCTFDVLPGAKDSNHSYGE